MRYLTHSIFLALLLCGVCAAQPTISVQDVPAAQYAQWLHDKESLWEKELDNLQVFAPEQVSRMEETRARIRANAEALDSASDTRKADLKAETNRLVYGLERSIEQTYAELHEKSGPVLVLNL